MDFGERISGNPRWSNQVLIEADHRGDPRFSGPSFENIQQFDGALDLPEFGATTTTTTKKPFSFSPSSFSPSFSSSSSSSSSSSQLDEEEIRKISVESELNRKYSRALVFLAIGVIGLVLVVGAIVIIASDKSDPQIDKEPGETPLVILPFDPSVNKLAHHMRMSVEGVHKNHVPTRLFPGQAEVVAYEPKNKEVYVTNRAENMIEQIDFSDPTDPSLTKIFPLFDLIDGSVESLCERNGILVATTSANPKTDPGTVLFLDIESTEIVKSIPVGALPSSCTFSPDGNFVIIGCEGEPSDEDVADDQYVDPEGSIWIIEMTTNTTEVTSIHQISFNEFNKGEKRENDLPSDLHLVGRDRLGDRVSVAQDLEPESIAVSSDSKYGYVVLQENNGIVVVDLHQKIIEQIWSCGVQDHSQVPLDASSKDNLINLKTYNNLYGLRQPDGISYYKGYIFLSNEGDGRESEEIEIQKIDPDLVDRNSFPNFEELQKEENLGGLRVSKYAGIQNGKYTSFFAFGGRSFSIFSHDGTLIFDSNDYLEQMTAFYNVKTFNCDSDTVEPVFDSRSPRSGPEPEGMAIGTIPDGRTFAFIGLERFGGIGMFDVTDPHNIFLEDYINTRNFDATLAEDVGDVSPEGLFFVSEKDSPIIGHAALFVGNSMSGTTTCIRLFVDNHEITNET